MKRNVVVGACALALACSFPLTNVPAAVAQLPGGLDPEAVKDMLPSQISVAAGETTTVDVGVPVNVSYAADGWTVSANGTTVSVTAPSSPGATAQVPASALGYSTTITLVAVGDETAPDVAPDGGAGNASTDQPAVTPAAPAVTHPPREAASPVDTSGAKTLYFDGEIQGSDLVVTVPLRRAAELAQYARADREGAKLRYLDVNGRIIQGVQRDVDIPSRTLTLRYPDGETPDNPFIMEVVRDGTRAEFIAVITATNASVEQADAEDDEHTGAHPYADVAENGQGTGRDSQDRGEALVPFIIGGVGVLVLLALLFTILRRRGTGRA